MASEQFSSRWKRIVRSISLPLPELFLEPGRSRFGPQLFRVPLRGFDVGVDPLPVLLVVGQRREDLGEGDGGVFRLFSGHRRAHEVGDVVNGFLAFRK
jgi:hypothetical protein